jgi:rhamnose transport system ATP-binding protein
LGENGAGKSTLIKLITGAHQPDDGAIEIGGQAVQRLNPALAHALGVAAIYQQPALFPDLSVAENIALGLEKPHAARRIRWNERYDRARELLRRIGAEIDPDRDVRQLSMPEQQLVEIARALGAGTRIMIMDEPTASLTHQEVQLLFGVIRELRSHGMGVIYISHRLDEIFTVADRVTVLRDGLSVGTHPVSEINEAGLITLMVGRGISTIFPPAERPPGAAVLSLRGVGCRASGVHNVTLAVRSGEVLGLAGLVGAGRTELARVLFGITPADAGEIGLDGMPLRNRTPRDAIAAGIGYLPEDRRRHGVILELPVAANITLGILSRLFPCIWLRRSAERQVADQYCRKLGVKTTSIEAPTSSLSGGNQQKVALARWLATKPKVLILDEPTQGVDIGAKAEIHKLIRRLAAEGLAILMISSDLPEILGMSDRIAVMRGGTITAMFDGAKATGHEVMVAALGHSAEHGAA